jgi:hypothetical protein
MFRTVDAFPIQIAMPTNVARETIERLSAELDSLDSQPRTKPS